MSPAKFMKTRNMLIGWWTMAILDLERSGRCLISTKNCTNYTSHSFVFCWGQKGKWFGCCCLDSLVTGWIRHFWESLLWWSCAEECLSSDCWTRGTENGHWTLDSFVSDRIRSFDFQVECTDRTVQYKLNAQSLRLFGLHRDVNDAHRAGANRLQKKKNGEAVEQDFTVIHLHKKLNNCWGRRDDNKHKVGILAEQEMASKDYRYWTHQQRAITTMIMVNHQRIKLMSECMLSPLGVCRSSHRKMYRTLEKHTSSNKQEHTDCWRRLQRWIGSRIQCWACLCWPAHTQ